MELLMESGKQWEEVGEDVNIFLRDWLCYLIRLLTSVFYRIYMAYYSHELENTASIHKCFRQIQEPNECVECNKVDKIEFPSTRKPCCVFRGWKMDKSIDILTKRKQLKD